jgi:phosphatidylinositol glycan class V
VPRKRRPQSTPPRKTHHAQPQHVKTAPLHPSSPLQTYLALTGIFIVWKLLLLGVVLATPTDGSGYDTSAALFFKAHNQLPSLVGQINAGAANSTAALHPSTLVSRITTRLTRWDAIYMVSAAWRGYVHEQDWAFSFGYTAFVGWLSKCMLLSFVHARGVKAA